MQLICAFLQAQKEAIRRAEVQSAQEKSAKQESDKETHNQVTGHPAPLYIPRLSATADKHQCLPPGPYLRSTAAALS